MLKVLKIINIYKNYKTNKLNYKTFQEKSKEYQLANKIYNSEYEKSVCKNSK